MRRLAILLVIAAASAVAVAACSKMAAVRLSGPLERPVAAVTDRDGGAWRRACLDRLDVWSGEAFRGEPMWSIRAAGESCVWVRSVTYGVVPDGFVAEQSASPLQAETRYEVHVHGWTKGFASVPWRGGGAFQYADGAWSSGS